MKSNQYGFSHLLIPIIVVVVIGGVGVAVSTHHNKSTSKSINLASHKTQQPTANNNAKTQTPISPLPTSSSTSAASKTTTGTWSQSSSANSTARSGSNTPASGSTTASQTPLQALTAIVSSLQAGQSAQVTAQNVSIPGPISTATGRPIVFSLNGQVYFAYTQEQRPNFSTTASQTANSMAIVNASGSYSLASAYLDKAAILVDPNQTAVGYSTGGD